jgi:hypothetical protein
MTFCQGYASESPLGSVVGRTDGTVIEEGSKGWPGREHDKQQGLWSAPILLMIPESVRWPGMTTSAHRWRRKVAPLDTRTQFIRRARNNLCSVAALPAPLNDIVGLSG